MLDPEIHISHKKVPISDHSKMLSLYQMALSICQTFVKGRQHFGNPILLYCYFYSCGYCYFWYDHFMF